MVGGRGGALVFGAGRGLPGWRDAIRDRLGPGWPLAPLHAEFGTLNTINFALPAELILSTPKRSPQSNPQHPLGFPQC